MDYAIIPLENSTNGSVIQTLDLLADRQDQYKDVIICDELFLTIHHCLLVGQSSDPAPPSKERITKLYTHPQAWGQCDAFLARYFKGVERQDVSSTSKAAEIVSTDHSGTLAAIASKFAADHYGARVVDTNIENKADNTTRFLIFRNSASSNTAKIPSRTLIDPSTEMMISSDSSYSVKKKKTLVSFRVNHSSPGALADTLLIFKTRGMNLTSISSRPSLAQPWQYIFFVECEWLPAYQPEEAVSLLIADLSKVTEFCRYWGSWDDNLDGSL